MVAYNFTAALILAMISVLHSIPIEVVYTGDHCDCPKSMGYVVNVPPPPEEKEYNHGDYGYKLDVPVSPKANVRYSFDFIVEEPKTTLPLQDEKLDLYAKVDRITEHKKDCIDSSSSTRRTRSSFPACGSPSCKCARCSPYRYVSALERALRRRSNSQKCGCSNSQKCGCSNCQCKKRPMSTRTISKPLNSNAEIEETLKRPAPTLVWAAIIKPRNDKTQNDVMPALKSRRRRDITQIFRRNRKTKPVRPSLRMVKQYNKSIQDSVDDAAKLIEKPKHFLDFQHLNFEKFQIPKPALPQWKPLLTRALFRNKRDIKGEYDLLEKERDQLDLTLPEIIQYMPETLHPNFKRGQCHFGCQDVSRSNEELLHRVQPQANTNEENANTLLDNLNVEPTTEQSYDSTTNADSQENNDENENNIYSSTSHTKRNAAQYGYSQIQLFNASPAPVPSYSYQPYNNQQIAIPTPFVLSSDGSYRSDAAIPQQYVGSQQYLNSPQLSPLYTNSAPVAQGRSSAKDDNDDMPLAPVYSPYMPPTYNPVAPSTYYDNRQLDQVIADIVDRHYDFIEASTHPGGELTDPTSVQKDETKSLLKLLMDNHWQKWFIHDAPPQEYRAFAFAPQYDYQPYRPYK